MYKELITVTIFLLVILKVLILNVINCHQRVYCSQHSVEVDIFWVGGGWESVS